MSSLRRILASRANRRRSHGPVTLPSSRSLPKTHAPTASSHPVSSSATSAARPSRNSSMSHLERFLADPIEYGCVEEVVRAAWRMRRAWAIETHVFDIAIRQLSARPTTCSSCAPRCQSNPTILTNQTNPTGQPRPKQHRKQQPKILPPRACRLSQSLKTSSRAPPCQTNPACPLNQQRQQLLSVPPRE